MNIQVHSYTLDMPGLAPVTASTARKAFARAIAQHPHLADDASVLEGFRRTWRYLKARPLATKRYDWDTGLHLHRNFS